jgi:hypothetical protein
MIKNSIRQYILQQLDIEPKEKSKVFILAIQAAFIGFFIGAYDISVHTIFLNIFPSEMLPKAYLISGLAGILLAFINNKLRQIKNFNIYVKVNLFIIFFITSCLYYQYNISNNKGYVFAMLVFMAPLNILAISVINKLVEGVFSPFQNKRLNRIVEAGQYLGIMSICLATPVFILFGFISSDFFALAIISIVFAFIFQFIISSKLKPYRNESNGALLKDTDEELQLSEIKNKFSFYLLAGIGLSVISILTIHFLFLSIAKQKYPEEQEFMKFLAAFTFTAIGFTLFIKFLVFERFIKVYGTKTGLLIAPVLLIILSIIAAILAILSRIPGFLIDFIHVFLFVALLKLLSFTIKGSVETPTYNTIYQLYVPKFREYVKNNLTVYLNEFFILITAVLLIGIITIGLTKYIPLLLIVTLILWFIIAIKLNKYFKKNISKIVSQNWHLHSELNLKPDIQNLPDDINTKAEEELQSLYRSKEIKDREKAAKIISQNPNESFVPILKALLHDIEPSVKIEAIKASAKVKSKDLCPLIVEFLSTPAYNTYAFDAIVETGEMAIDFLEQLYNKTNNSNTVISRIIKALGTIGGEKALQVLVNKLLIYNYEISMISAIQLQKRQFNATENNYSIIIHNLKLQAKIAAWNIITHANLIEEQADKVIVNAMNEEIKISINNLYVLLSLVCGSELISNLKLDIENEQNENNEFALIILELYFDKELKDMLIPIFDGSSVNNKRKKLQYLFPSNPEELENILIHIINRNYNYINVWTKACAIKSLISLPNIPVSETIIAQMFNPNYLLCETASVGINSINSNEFKAYITRLNGANHLKIEELLVNQKMMQENLLLFKTLFLKQTKHFSAVPGHILYRLADLLSTIHAEKDYIFSDVYTYLFISGNLIIQKNGNDTKEIEQYEMFGLSDIEKGSTFIVKEEAMLYAIKNDELQQFLIDFDVAQTDLNAHVVN